MQLEGERVLLRVFLRNTDKSGWGPAVDALVQQAHDRGMGGGTVQRGIFGLDVAGNLFESGWWSLAERVPVVVEIIDTAEAICRFLPVVGQTVPDCMATLERAHVLIVRRAHGDAGRSPLPSNLPEAVPPLSTLPKRQECPSMNLSEEGRMLRVFIGESDVWEGVPLFRAIVLKARELGLAGATVFRGSMGFGANSRVHSSKLLELSTDLPLVVEIIDSPEKIELILPFVDQAVAEGLVTIEAVQVLHYRHNNQVSGG